MVYQRVTCPDISYVSTTIPVPGVKALLAVLRGWKATNVSIGSTDSHTIIRNGPQALGITKYSYPFPDISPYLDGPRISHTEKLTFLVSEFRDCLRQVALSAPPDTGHVRMDLNSVSKLKLSAKTLEGSSEAWCSCTWEGRVREVWFDYRVLDSVLSASGEKEKITIAFGPDSVRTPSSLFISEKNLTASIIQLRALR